MEVPARNPLTRATPNQRVLGLVGFLVLIDFVLLSITWSNPAPVNDVSLPVWLIVPVFILVEWRAIHIQVRSEASSFSLFEIPLAVGLLYVAPVPLAVAVMASVAVALKLGRSQPGIKVAFNAANVLFNTLLAGWVAQLALGGSVMDRRTWFVVIAATAVGSISNLTMIMAVIALTEGALDRARVIQLSVFGLVVGQSTTAVGLAAAILLSIDVLGLLLLAVPGALMLVALRVYASEQAQRERVEILYRSTRNLDFADSDDGLITLLNEARETFKAEVGAILLVNDGDTPARAVICSDNEPYTGEWPAGVDHESLVQAMAEADEPTLVTSRANGPLALITLAVGGNESMVARLATDDRDHGLLVIANRRGDVTSFSREDLRVLAALARQSAVLLHSDQLEQALTELQKLERRLAHQAHHDSLTSLPNRALFDTRLEEATATPEPFTVLFIDLDDFKAVNDTYGHAAGDQVLNEVARRLTALIRGEDTVARLGGDEFALLLCSAVDPVALAERIVTQVSVPIDIDQGTVQVGCSIGLARSGIDDEGRGTSQLLRHADQAMYQAKQAGKGAAVEGTPDTRADQPVEPVVGAVFSGLMPSSDTGGHSPQGPASTLVAMPEFVAGPERGTSLAGPGEIEVPAALQGSAPARDLGHDPDSLPGPAFTSAPVGWSSVPGIEGLPDLVPGPTGPAGPAGPAGRPDRREGPAPESGPELTQDPTPEPGGETGLGSDTRLDPDPSSRLDPNPDTGPASDPDTRLDPDPDSGPASDPDTRLDPDPASGPASDPDTRLDPDPDSGPASAGGRSHSPHRIDPSRLDDQLVVHYQPVFHPGSGAMAGLETLVRMRAPGGSLLRPAQFMPDAEADGTVVAVDRWVLRRAVTDLTTHLADHFEAHSGTDDQPFFVSVNLSPQQFTTDDFADQVAELVPLLGSGADPDNETSSGFGGRLMVEVAEQGLAADHGRGQPLTRALRDLGVAIALDDFGAGPSSFSRLRELDLDLVKLAATLTSSVTGDDEPEASHQVMAALVDLGHALGLRVVGKRIESPEQLEAMRDLGCDLLQGYHLSRPMPVHSLTELDPS